MQPETCDVLVIGGGVVGCAVLWALARYDLRLMLCEAENDVGQGISRANTAIAHTGFDAPPGSLEARLITRSQRVFAALCEQLGVDLRPCGALMLALDQDDFGQLDSYERQAAANGIPVERLSAEAVRTGWPYVNPAVQGGLRIPGEASVDSFGLTLAYAEVAVGAGARLLLDEPVASIEQHGDCLVVATARRRIAARYVINAAGLHAGEIAGMVGDGSFAIRPRKGQLIVIDPASAPPIDTILLPTPTPRSKGILIAPAAHGNLLLGPTAEDSYDLDDWATSADGLAMVWAGARRLAPGLELGLAIAQYAGLRSVGSEGDYIIRPAASCPRLLHVAGIRSTGLSASPAIGEYVAELLRDGGLELRPSIAHSPSRARPLRAAGADDATLAALLAHDRSYGQIVCPCGMVSAGEVRAAIHGPVPARTLDALKRRLWVMAGPCQGS
ncbi:MAG TPA: NAD(P)/FAD-dependent oxidoreductase, partial [Roseiflexaceae bacterium]|nr:NAD(P)/FAD-dependent oxidoreductase [Roseiflexaceae bacterium]